LVLLFFAVSMSDDMHSEIIALEESSLSKRDQVFVSASAPLLHPDAVRAPVWATTAQGAVPLPSRNAFGTVLPEVPSLPRFVATDPRCSRAPPVSIL